VTRVSKDLDGVLVLDKPQGPTSSFVVQRVRRLLAIDKIGHTGTLDPMATGVLPLCLGKATALAQLLTGEDKRYLAQLRLGARTDSGDAEGKVIEERPIPDALDADQVRAALAAMLGPQQQLPPMVSAVKVGGQRLYELARKGLEVERTPREIRIHALELQAWARPELSFEVHCSKGTYVRTLGEALAERLGTVGHLVALRRLASGRLDLSRAITLDAIEKAASEERARLIRGALIPMESAIGDMARVVVRPDELRALSNGHVPRRSEVGPPGPRAVVDEAGKLVALATVEATGKLALSRVLVQPADLQPTDQPTDQPVDQIDPPAHA
jgi:tRNA pseudouridine55 synthase